MFSPWWVWVGIREWGQEAALVQLVLESGCLVLLVCGQRPLPRYLCPCRVCYCSHAPIVLWALTCWAASDHFFLPHPCFADILVEYLSFGYDSHLTST